MKVYKVEITVKHTVLTSSDSSEELLKEVNEDVMRYVYDVCNREDVMEVKVVEDDS